MEQDDKTNLHQRNYELLGAPLLLYRNEQAYTQLDVPPPPYIVPLEEWFRTKRAQARWYYPMDFHRMKYCITPANAKESRDVILTRPSSRQYVLPDKVGSDDDEDEDEDDDEDDVPKKDGVKHKSGQLAKQRQLVMMARQAHKDQHEQIQQLPNHSFQLQEEARRFLLREHDTKRSYRPRLLAFYRQFDSNAFPAKLILRKKASITATTTTNKGKGQKKQPTSAEYGFTNIQVERLERYRHERKNYADPAYLAPWQATSWMNQHELLHGGVGVQKESDFTKFSYAGEFGNCLASFPCQCQTCRQSDTPTWWLLHPTGPLLETIQLSQIAAPGGRKVWRNGVFVYNRQSPVLQLDDGVRQICPCQNNLFVARGSHSFTIFRLFHAPFRKNPPPSEDVCLGSAMVLESVEVVDLRSFIRGALSYLPLHVAAHPRFGNALTDAKVAVAFESQGRNESNVIYQYMIGEQGGVRCTHHAIANLQCISEVQYSPQHPMVLWASARSFVQSLPTQDYFKSKPRAGFGTALYSIDLRSCKGTFQWSPSSEEFAVEGVHSLSSVLTDWTHENALFAASLSAKKTWELDMRMPCRAVTYWSLPYYGEGPGSKSDEFGVFGAGMLLDRPQCAQKSSIFREEPILAVNCTPGAAGIHLYQKPNHSPMFYCPPIESVHVPQANSFTGAVATSKVFPLADTIGQVFTCGLSTIRLPTKLLFPSPHDAREVDILDSAPTSLCVLTATNKGDVYLHPLLESKSKQSLAKYFEDVPVGSASVPVPRESAYARPNPCPTIFNNCLSIRLSNEYPVPSSAIVLPLETKVRSEEKDGKKRWTPRFRDVPGSTEMEPNNVQPLVLSTGGVATAASVEKRVMLPPPHVDAQTEAFLQTLECFDDTLLRVQRKRMRGDTSERTDLTPDVIDKAELHWTQNDYDALE